MKQRIDYLLAGWFNKTLSEEESAEFWQLLDSSQYDDEFKASLDDYWFNLEPGQIMTPERKEKVYARITGAKVVEMGKRRIWIRWVAAASIIIIAGIVVMLSVSKHDNGVKQVAQTHDVPAPANTRAVITLADGSKVYLDSAGNGTIAQQNNVKVVKNDSGVISYELNREDAKTQGDASTPLSMTYNTLYNPRGSKVISLTLSDGTKVWLNSESSLKYPTAFNSNTREVEISGEAYFEVKHDAKQPFKVHLPNGSVVEDIGTAFNVNAYADESDIKTTLIEGAVKVTAANAATAAVKLKPGQQAINPANPLILRILVQDNVDIDAITAWKDGFFQFDHTDTKTMLRQISRWYDVSVRYEGDIPNRQFGGRINRNLNLSEVLDMLKSSGVHFRIEGKELIVTK